MLPPEALPAFFDNYIWRFCPGAGPAWLVDPGDRHCIEARLDAGEVFGGVLITHHHDDHIGALDLLVAHAKLPVVAPHDSRIAQATVRVGDGDRVRCGDVEFTVMATPGHTLSHICFVGGGVLFCGDTLFSLGCGRLFEGSAEQMLRSLDRLAALPGDLIVCPAHEYTESNLRFAEQVEPSNPDLIEYGNWIRAQRSRSQPTLPSRLDRERHCNPFLRSRSPGVLAALGRHCGRMIENDIDGFAELRRWKDGFKA